MSDAASICPECGAPSGRIHAFSCSRYPDVQKSAARGWDGDKTLPHLDDCTLPADHDGPCDSAMPERRNESSAAQGHNSDIERLIAENHEAWAKVNALQAALDWIEGDSSEGFRLVREARAAVEEALSRV